MSFQMFALFDSNKSGTVDLQEFLLGLATSTPKDPPGTPAPPAGSRLYYIFTLYDSSGKGFVAAIVVSSSLSGSFLESGS